MLYSQVGGGDNGYPVYALLYSKSNVLCFDAENFSARHSFFFLYCIQSSWILCEIEKKYKREGGVVSPPITCIYKFKDFFYFHSVCLAPHREGNFSYTNFFFYVMISIYIQMRRRPTKRYIMMMMFVHTMYM